PPHVVPLRLTWLMVLLLWSMPVTSAYAAEMFVGQVGMAVDQFGNTYIAGTTTFADLPTTSGALRRTFNTTTCYTYRENPIGGGFPRQARPCRDIYVAKLNPAGTALIYATYLGGDGDDDANGIAVDSTGNVYLAGASDFQPFVA